MECNFPHIESNQNGDVDDVYGFDSAVQNWFVYFSTLHFLRALWLAFHIQKGALTSWTRLCTEYIRWEREGSERDRERPRTSENQAIHGALDPWNPYIKIEILIYCPYTFSIEVVGIFAEVSIRLIFPDHVLNSHDNSVFQSIDVTRRNFMLITPGGVGGGGYSGFQVTGMFQWGQKLTTQKIPWASNKTPKNTRNKI